MDNLPYKITELERLIDSLKRENADLKDKVRNLEFKNRDQEQKQSRMENDIRTLASQVRNAHR